MLKQLQPVATLVLPGDEDPAVLMRRGGIELSWSSGGQTRKISKFQEKQSQLPHVVDQDIALPTLYLQFLPHDFLVKEGEYNTSMRAGNDNSELAIALPLTEVPHSVSDAELKNCLDIVMKFLRTHSEVMTSNFNKKPGGFGPKQNFTVTVEPERLYFSLRTARPKSAISFGKAPFGIPEDAELYLFAENHISVAYMDPEGREAFERCIAEFPAEAATQRFGVFLKVFYEGGFAYNSKVEMGSGYQPKCVGIASLGVEPAFEGQSGISTGYPYNFESRFLPFADTVPVTIRGISEMSDRHKRYGVCFTRGVFVWEGDRFQREGVLNFCSVAPHGGFYYVPSTLKEYGKLGGLLYAFGEARDTYEVPVSVEVLPTNSTVGPPTTSTAPAPAPPSDDADRRLCVICIEEPAVYAAIPCGHKSFCGNCKQYAQGKNCPICRQRVTSTVRIFD